MKRFAAASLFFTILFPPALQAETLGRLFFTPEERIQLEQEQAAARDDNSIPMLNGIVQRNGGPRTIWINGMPQDSGSRREQAQDSQAIDLPGEPLPVRLKVGQRLSH